MTRTAAERAASDERRAADTRLAFIDNARATGIVLVVLGHAPGLPSVASDFIFAFHMPLFFALSGLMVGRERLAMPVARRAALLGKTLLLPYLLYFVVSWVYWLAFKRHGLRAGEFESLPWWDPVVSFAIGNGDRLYANVVLWFFPCLFVVALVHHVVARRWTPTAAAFVFVPIAFVYSTLREPGAARWLWSADCAVVAIGFYAAGAACNAALRRPRGIAAPVRIATAVVGLGGCFALARLSGHVDLNHLSFGRIPALYVPMGALGTIGILAAASRWPATATARWLSTNTLTIFPLHFLMFSVVTGIAVAGLHLSPTVRDAPLAAPVYTLVALAASVPTAAVVRRLLRTYWSFHARLARSTPLPAR